MAWPGGDIAVSLLSIYVVLLRVSNMSTLWTPSGERPIPPRQEGEEGTPIQRTGSPGQSAGDRVSASSGRAEAANQPRPESGSDAEQAAVEAQMREMQERLLSAPSEQVIANHCYGLFELAAVYLSSSPPRLDGARLAIDSLGLLVDGLGNRLGEAGPQLLEALTQIRLAFASIANTSRPDSNQSAVVGENDTDT